MTNIQPIYLEDEFAAIVAKVSAKLTPCLQASNPLITGVHYEFGHPIEIIETLTQKDAGVTTPFDKYPVICLFLDIDSGKRGVSPGIYGTYKLHMAIIAATEPDLKAKQRLEINFKPILEPIYLELMKQISYRGDLFELPLLETVPHTAIRRYYWGRDGLWKKEGNIFNDYIDAIEIKDLELKVNIDYCPNPANQNLLTCQ